MKGPALMPFEHSAEVLSRRDIMKPSPRDSRPGAAGAIHNDPEEDL